MEESTDNKTFATEVKDHVHTITVHGADDSLQWAVADKGAKAPVAVTRSGSTLTATTRDEATAAEIQALLKAAGYRG